MYQAEIERLMRMYRDMTGYPREDEFLAYDNHVLWIRGDGGSEFLTCPNYGPRMQRETLALVAALLEFVRKQSELRN
jgi:hypothetical protein